MGVICMENRESGEVFFSWSGDKSKEIALKFQDLFKHVFEPAVTSFMSARDIGVGRRSLDVLFSKLEQCNYGVCFVDAENARAPWIQFEAGALSKLIDTSRVMVLSLDGNVQSLEGTPLNEFQHKLFNKDDIKSIFEGIIESYKLEKSRDIIIQRFDGKWDNFYRNAQIILEKGEEQKKVETDEDGKLDIIMKMLVGVQNLLKTEWTQNIKDGKSMVNELKSIICSMKPEDLLKVQLSFKIQRYELFSQQIIHEIEEVIEEMDSGEDEKCIERSKNRLERIIQNAISLIGD